MLLTLIIHLVLFGRVSLTRALAGLGFTDVTFHPRYAGAWFWLVSGAIARGLEPHATGSLSREERRSLRREGRAADRRVVREPHRAEEFVATARRPDPAR